MKFVAAKCPSCGGDLQVPDDRDFVKCTYCGADVKVRDVLKISIDTNIPNLLKLGNEALRSGNNQEAFDYYNKVLEADIENYEAWYGKAISAGYPSELADVRVQEMVMCFDNSLRYCPVEKQNKLKGKISDEIYNISLLYYNLANGHMKAFINLYNTWGEYLKQCNEILYILDYSHQLNPKNENIVTTSINLCYDNLNGYRYYENVLVNRRTKKVKRIKTITNDYRNTLLNKINEYENILKNLNPEKWKKEQRVKSIRINNNQIVYKTIIIFFFISVVLATIIGTIVGMISKSNDTGDDIIAIIFLIMAFGVTAGAIIGFSRRTKFQNINNQIG